MSVLSTFTDRFLITPVAKRLTQLMNPKKIEKADTPVSFGVPFGFNGQSLDSERRQMGSSVDVGILRRMSVTHETTRAAINVRKRQINQLYWNINDADLDGESAYSNQELNNIKKVFMQIGGPGIRFSEMMNKLIEDVLVLDAFCFYKQRTRGGKLLRIIPVDATTIKMRVDEAGMRPLPPEVAFEQWVRGEKVAELTTEDLVYESMNPRTNSVFGLSPLETLVLTVDASLRATLYNLNYLSDNNLPPGFLTGPAEWTTQQVKEYKEFFDAAISGPKAQNKIFMIPSGSTYTTVSKPKDFQFKEFFEYLDRKTCMLFDVTPQELGMTGQQYKENADSQENIQMRKGLKPLAHFIEEIFTDLIQNDLGYTDLAFKFKGLETKYSNQDAKDLIPIGVISVDDVRIDRGEKPLGVGPFVLNGNGAIPVEQIGMKPVTISGTDTPQLPTGTDAPPVKIDPPVIEPPPDEPVKKQANPIQELRAWEAKALNDVRKKGKIYRHFVSEFIPDNIHKWISIELRRATSQADVRKIFKGQKLRQNKGLELLEADKKFGQFKSSIKAGVLNALKPFTNVEIINKLIPAKKMHKAGEDEVDVEEYFGSVDIEGFDEYLKWAAKQGGQQAYEALGIKGTFNLTNEQFKKILGDRENYLINSVDSTTKDWIVDQIMQGKAEGLTNAEIADKIANLDEDFSDARADVIVNTEVANALQTSELDTYREQGIEKKRWVASDDDLVDPICADLDGEVADVDDDFSTGDDTPPAHPNCRCYVQAVLSDELEEGQSIEDLRKDWVTIRGNPVFIEDGASSGSSGTSSPASPIPTKSLAEQNKGKSIKQIAEEHQARDLTSYERAYNSGDQETMRSIASKHPGDPRFSMHERAGGEIKTPMPAKAPPLGFTPPTVAHMSPELVGRIREVQSRSQ